MTKFDMVVTIDLCIEVTADDYDSAEESLRQMDDAELFELASTIQYEYSGEEHFE